MSDVEKLAAVLRNKLAEWGGNITYDDVEQLAQSVLTALPSMGWALRNDVLEEAAKVADESKCGRTPGPLYDAGFYTATEFVAKRIRSLKEG